MNHNSIVFDLDLDLKLLSLSFVNSENKPVLESINTIEEVWREDKSLNLSGIFESIWAKHYETYFKSADEFFLFIGPKAGFTDSRVIYLWLKTQLMFDNKLFYVYKLPASLDIQNQDLLLTKDLLQTAREIDNKSLTYSAEPRIGLR